MTAATSARLARHGSKTNLKGACSTECRVLAAKLRAAGGLRLEVSLGTWGPDPVLYQLFCDTEQEVISDRKKNDTEMGQAPTSQARPRDTDRLRPSNLTARTLSLVEHTISMFCCDPCPVGQGLVAAVKCYVRKARIFLRRQRREMTHHYRRHCSRVSVR